MHVVGIGDLPRGEAGRRHDPADAADAGDKTELFQISERRHQ